MKEPDEGWNNILFRREWAEILRKLPDNLRLAVWDAIGEYILTGNDPEDATVLYSPYITIKTQIEKDKDNYNKTIVDRNRRNGQKGGRPKAENENQNKPKKPNGLLKTQINPNKPEEEKEKEDEKEDVLSYDNIVEDTNVSLSSSDDHDSENDDAETVVEVVGKKKNAGIDFNAFMTYWNEKMLGSMIPKLTKLSDSRKRMIAARCREHGKDGLQRAIENVVNSSFLIGSSFFSFDWFIRPNNFLKVLEGNYADRSQSPPQRIMRKIQESQYREAEAAARIMRLRAIDEAENKKKEMTCLN